MSSNIPSRGTFQSLKALAASLPRSRYVPPIVAALAILLASPSLGTGLHIDDFYHRTVLRPGSPYRDLLGPPAEMFRFFRGDPERTVRIMDIGAFPWWTDPTLKAEFLQALTVLTYRLDYALWPRLAGAHARPELVLAGHGGRRRGGVLPSDAGRDMGLGGSPRYSSRWTMRVGRPSDSSPTATS